MAGDVVLLVVDIDDLARHDEHEALPALTSPVAIAIMFSSLFSTDYGIDNTVLKGLFGIEPIDNITNRQVRLLDSPHRSAGFAVLKAPDIPSVLVEAGFMSNKKESELLNTPAHRAKISQALSGAIDSYFEQVRKNQRI